MAGHWKTLGIDFMGVIVNLEAISSSEEEGKCSSHMTDLWTNPQSGKTVDDWSPSAACIAPFSTVTVSQMLGSSG